MVPGPKVKDGVKLSGKITIKAYRAGFVEAVQPILEAIRHYRTNPPNFPVMDIALALKSFREQLESLKEEYYLSTPVECHNLVVDSPGYGLDLIIQRLVGTNTYSLNLAWIELGTGTNTPSVNDTALQTPSVRIPLSFQEDYGATDAIVQAYITDANLPNATYTEAGSFVDGTASIGSGQLFNRALLSPTYVKVSGQDTTVEVDITIVNS